MSNIMHVIIKAPKYPTLVFVYLFIFSITSRLNIVSGMIESMT